MAYFCFIKVVPLLLAAAQNGGQHIFRLISMVLCAGLYERDVGLYTMADTPQKIHMRLLTKGGQ